MKKADRETVFNKYAGKCAYCGTDLVKGWHVDHLEAIKRNSVYDRAKGRYITDGTCKRPENENMINYMPACASCNINKHSMPLESFRSFINGFVTSLNRDSTQYKIAKRYGLVVEEIKPIVFYFEGLPHQEVEQA